MVEIIKFEGDKQNIFWQVFIYGLINAVLLKNLVSFSDSVCFVGVLLSAHNGGIIIPSFVSVHFDCCLIMSMYYPSLFRAITNTIIKIKLMWENCLFGNISIQCQNLKVETDFYSIFLVLFRIFGQLALRPASLHFFFIRISFFFICKIFSTETKCCVLKVGLHFGIWTTKFEPLCIIPDGKWIFL